MFRKIDDPDSYIEVLAETVATIGRNVYEKRIESNYSQRNLGYLSNVETNSISRIERGICESISIKILVKLSIALNCKVEDFLK